jgi:very-short-patch-repair endonuclease
LDNEAIASHWTAACLHGLVAPRPLIDVTVRRAGSTREAVADHPQQPRVRIHSSTNLPESDVVRHGAIPVTSVARTALGLAALVPRELSRRGLFDLVSQAVDLGLASDPWLWWLLTERRCRGRNGVIALETALAERTRLGPTESWLEREVIRILETAGIPLPVTQRVIRRRGRFAARVDFVYEQDLVVIEALGYAHHRSKAQLAADLERANRLQLLGYAVYQFTTEQIVATPSLLVSTVRAARENAHRRLAA